MSKKEHGVGFISLKNDTTDLHERITDIIWNIYRRNDILTHPKDREVLIKFLPFLKPSQSKIDYGALPYYSKSPRARQKHTAICLLTFISCFFIDWMTIPTLDLNETRELIILLRKKCDYLESIVSLGLGKFVIEGSIAKGFILMTPEEAAEEAYYDECVIGRYKKDAIEND